MVGSTAVRKKVTTLSNNPKFNLSYQNTGKHSSSGINMLIQSSVMHHETRSQIGAARRQYNNQNKKRNNSKKIVNQPRNNRLNNKTNKPKTPIVKKWEKQPAKKQQFRKQQVRKQQIKKQLVNKRQPTTIHSTLRTRVTKNKK